MIINCTAASLRAILCFIDPINADRLSPEDLNSKMLIDRIKESVANSDGIDSVSILFNRDELELQEKFSFICEKIEATFNSLKTKK